MFNSSDFNLNNLFQNFNGWYQGKIKDFNKQYEGLKIENIDKTTEDFAKLKDSFETILIHANSIIINLANIRMIERRVISYFNKVRSRLTLKEKRIIIYVPLITDLLGKISAILSSITFIQNKIVRLIGRELNVNLPQSMNRVITGRPQKYKIKVENFRIIKRYWSRFGKRVKVYRDVDQHHFVLASNVYLELKPKEKILVMFPDNPEVKKIEEFTYNNNYDAIEFLEKSFTELHSFIEEVAKEFGYKQEKFAQGINLDKVGELREKNGTIAVMIENVNPMRGLFINYDQGNLEIHPI